MPLSFSCLLAQARVAPRELQTLGPLTLPTAYWHVLGRAGSLVLTVIVALVLVRLVPLLERVVQRIAARHGDPRDATASTLDRQQHFDTLAKVTTSVARNAIWTMTLIVALGDLGIAVGPLLATAGVAGVAIGFGAQSIVKDFFGGFFILLENQFDVGDTVVIGGVTGTVERMTMRVTVLRDPDGTVFFFPNSGITSVANKTYGWGRAVVEATFAASVPESDVHEGLAAAASRATETLRRDHLLADAAVTVEGPVNFVAGRTTWQLVAKVGAESVGRARATMILALATEVRSRKYIDAKGILTHAE